MTPPNQLALDIVWEDATVTPEFRSRAELGVAEQSHSVYPEVALRRAADTVLRDPQREVELRRLMRAGTQGVRAVLDEAASTPREEVLHAAAEVLARLGAFSGGFTWLDEQAASNPSAVKRALAVRAIGYQPGVRLEQRCALERALRDPQPEVREVAANALSELGDGAAVSALREALSSEQVATIARAIREALDELGG